MTLRSFYRWIYDACMRNLNERRIQPNSLLKYAYNTYSQMGEDGIIDHIMNTLGIRTGFFVEFGAWDGIHLSNTRRLAENGWRGVFIEADPKRFQQLSYNYRHCSRVVCVHARVTTNPQGPGEYTFDAIADRYFPGQEITLLSVDVDGEDAPIFESIRRKAVLAIVEGGALWHPEFNRRVPDDIAQNNLQQPLSIMCDIGRSKGYEPVCFTTNTFFIDNAYFSAFAGIRNDPATLWKDFWYHLDFYSRVYCAQGHRKDAVRRLEGQERANITFEHYLFDKLNIR